MADKVVTEHAEANAAVGRLREVATTVKELGDALVLADRNADELKAEIARHDELLAELTDHAETHKRWESLLEDFKRGIVDRDELLAGTIGK